MTLEQYIKKLEALKDHGQRAVIEKVPSLEKFAYQLLADLVDDGLDVQGGRFVPNEQALRTLNTFTDRYLGAFTEYQPYQGAIAQFLKNFKDLNTLMLEFQRSQGVDVKPARLLSVHEIMVSEIINRYSANGLNPDFVQPLRNALFNNVTSGTNKMEAMAELRGFIAGGRDVSGKLGRYLEQTAQQAVDSYTGAINTRVMQTFDINTMIMSGSLIKTSSTQCRYALNKLDGIIDREDWPKLEKMAAEEGLIEGTTFDNLPFNKLHWGCRHEFTPTVLSDDQRKRSATNPVNN